jgi:TetR/AcrR family transcriptional repressor of nem operon
MPYPAQHKAETRGRIVEAARRLFNRQGFEQVSIDEIMKDAGLTRGGFYKHFASKDALYVEAVSSFVSCNPFNVELEKADPPITDPKQLARMLVNLYLSEEVFADKDKHCPLYALPSDVARAGLKPQKAYTYLIRGMAKVFQTALDGTRDAEQRAQTIVSLCVGGMVLARTTNDTEFSKSLREASRKQALEMLR